MLPSGSTGSRGAYHDWMRWVLLILIVVLLVAYEVSPGDVTLNGWVVALLGLLVVLIAFPLLEEATLPGGGGLKFRKEDVKAVESVAERVEQQREDAQPAERVVVGGVRGGLRTGGRVEVQARLEPVAAVAQLRADLERTLRHAYESQYDESAPESATRVVERLLLDDHLSADQAELALRLFALANAAVHFGSVSADDANRLLRSAQALNDSIKRSRLERAVAFEREVSAVLERSEAVKAASIVFTTANFRPDAVMRRRDGRKIVIEAKYVDPSDPRSVRRLQHAASLVRSAMIAIGAEEGMIVVPEPVDAIAPDDLEVRVVTLADLPAALDED